MGQNKKWFTPDFFRVNHFLLAKFRNPWYICDHKGHRNVVHCPGITVRYSAKNLARLFYFYGHCITPLHELASISGLPDRISRTFVLRIQNGGFMKT